MNHPETCRCQNTECPRYQDCEACREYHYAKDSLPACERRAKGD